MNIEEAYKILGVLPGANEIDRHEAFLIQRKKLEEKLSKAPTPGLAQKYRDSIARMEEAIEVIELAADGGDLPSLRPDYDAVDVVTADMSAEPEYEKNEALGAKKIKAQASGAGSKKEILIAAVVVLLLCGACAGWWFGSEAPRREQVAALVVKAKGLEEKGALQKAADIYEDALEVKRSSKEAEAGLARVRGELDRVSAESERKKIRIASELSREVDRLLVAARMDLSQENWADSLVDYKKVVSLDATNVEAGEASLRLEKLLTNARGAVVVKTDLGGATVRLSGRGEDTSPANYEDMKLGSYSVEVEKKGYDPVKKSVLVRKDDTTVLGPIRLNRSKGALTINSEPSGVSYTVTQVKSDVRTDKEFEPLNGKTPAVEADLATGIYQVVMEREGWDEYRKNVSVKRDFKESVEVSSKEWKERLEAGTRREFVIYPSLTVAFRWCPATEEKGFMMGGPKRVKSQLQHRVVLTKGFWLAETECTQEQWQAVTGNNPSMFKNAGVNAPVESVSWDDIQGFLKKLNESGKLPAGVTVALPTEAQWEYACRSGTQTVFHYGNSLSIRDANIKWGHAGGGTSKGADKKSTLAVKSYAANAWGLHDMHGNVWERCSDWWGEDYYATQKAMKNPTGPSSGDRRVTRGGSWFNNDWICGSGERSSLSPSSVGGEIGFCFSLQLPD